MNCGVIPAALNSTISNFQCVASNDLTTANPDTTPADNSILGLPPGAFVPRSDRVGVAPASSAYRTPITKAVPGLQIAGTMSDNLHARWVLRLPDQWNGRLVVAASTGIRSEYSGDWIYSDYLVQQGYAYIATNKGHLQSRPGSLDDPKSCHAAPPGVANSGVLVHARPDDKPDGGHYLEVQLLDDDASEYRGLDGTR